jgi:lipopolysaccharide transport system ATP-binding protein
MENVVVRISGVSKAYRLWAKPSDRLLHPLKSFFNLLVPVKTLTLEATQNFNEFYAVKNITLEIRKGESWGFIGVNGSGKSTLLKMISGNLRPSSGTIEVDGKVAILDYGSGFNGEFTGRQNIYIKGVLLGLSHREIDERIGAIQEFADIGEFIDQPVKVYSSGMVARLGFAIMAHVDAEIIITDEALAVGDAFFVQKCMRHIRNFVKKGTFLFVSHSVNDVMSLCDHAVWLKNGEIMKVGHANEVCKAYIASIEQKTSEAYISDEVNEEAKDVVCESFEVPIDAPSSIAISKSLKFDAQSLANLKKHFLWDSADFKEHSSRAAWIEAYQKDSGIGEAINADHGVGGGRIINATLLNKDEKELTSISGGERVFLTLVVIAERVVQRPILGFQLKNSLGLSLVAENSFLMTEAEDMCMKAGEMMRARFEFTMPLLAVGEYVFRVGFADGTENDNALLDVKHEAILLRSIASSARHGLIGVPMLSVQIDRLTAVA